MRSSWAAIGVGVGILVASFPSISQNSSLEERLAVFPQELAAEVRKRLEEAGGPIPQLAHRTAVLEELGAKYAAAVPVAVRVQGSASASARCPVGTVVESRYRVSVADVEIVAEEQLDCDQAGCRAFQVTAKRASGEPFDLEVSVTCSGR